jgi:hypothetical protein
MLHLTSYPLESRNGIHIPHIHEGAILLNVSVLLDSVIHIWATSDLTNRLCPCSVLDP